MHNLGSICARHPVEGGPRLPGIAVLGSMENTKLPSKLPIRTH